MRSTSLGLLTKPFRSIEMSDPALAPPNTRLMTVYSENLGGRGDIAFYNTNAEGASVPLIIFLHGVKGSHWAWMYSGGVHLVYEALRREGLREFVLAMPSDGLVGDGSGYLPRASGDFEAWVVADTPAAARIAIPAVTEASRIYLCGLSMGGFGALRIGAKFAEQVSGVSAHSAITKVSEFAQFTDRNVLEDLKGDAAEAGILHWVDLHQSLLPPMRLDCGADDKLLAANRSFSEALTARGVQHQYQEAPGGHNWAYWRKQVVETLRFFDTVEGQRSRQQKGMNANPPQS